MQNICVYCGSSHGALAAYTELARNLGQLLAERSIGLIYGGGKVGLMGEIADAALAAGGEVIGVIPTVLSRKELIHTGCTELHEVDSMHSRKALMEQLADGFIALPGGFGTMDELFEIITWAQLGLHQKPIGLLNCEHYYDPLLTFIEQTVSQKFVRTIQARLVLHDDEPVRLLQRLQDHQVPAMPKWISREES